MSNYPEGKILHCLNRLGHFYALKLENADHHLEMTVLHAGRFSLQAISKSDAAYHDVGHTILVTLTGQAILEGLQVSGGCNNQNRLGLFTTALLFHDIGYIWSYAKGKTETWWVREREII